MNRCVRILARKSIDAVRFHFDKCETMKPHHLATLSCLIEEYHIYDIKILFNVVNTSVCSYLNSLKFFKYWNGDLDRTEFVESEEAKAMNLWKIKKESISAYAIKAEQYFRYNGLHDKNLDPIGICLGEMFNNIFDHSGSQVDGYVISQFYSSKNEVAIAVADFGIGIPKSVNNFLHPGEKGISDEEALLWALQLGNTVQSEKHNKGFGLNTMHSTVNKLNSRMVIYSGNCVYYHTKSGKEIFSDIGIKFPGTTLTIFLDTQNLGESEEMEEDATLW